MTKEQIDLVKQIKEITRRQAMIENKINALYECYPANADLVKAFTMIEASFAGGEFVTRDMNMRPGK